MLIDKKYIIIYMTQKIIIFGFPHTGTSILKSIIGHCENVEEIINESITISKITKKDFIESIATVGMILATTYMFYFLGYVFFGA